MNTHPPEQRRTIDSSPNPNIPVLRPEGTGPSPVVVVLHGGLGLNKVMMSVAEDVRRAGFVVVIGCWQAGQAQAEGNRLCSEATPQAEWLADPATRCCAKELIAMARSLSGARVDRLGLYGLSIGGQAALWVASTGANVQAVVADAPPSAKPRERYWRGSPRLSWCCTEPRTSWSPWSKLASMREPREPSASPSSPRTSKESAIWPACNQNHKPRRESAPLRFFGTTC